MERSVRSRVIKGIVGHPGGCPKRVCLVNTNVPFVPAREDKTIPNIWSKKRRTKHDPDMTPERASGGGFLVIIYELY